MNVNFQGMLHSRDSHTGTMKCVNLITADSGKTDAQSRSSNLESQPPVTAWYHTEAIPFLLIKAQTVESGLFLDACDILMAYWDNWCEDLGQQCSKESMSADFTVITTFCCKESNTCSPQSYSLWKRISMKCQAS